MAILETDRNSLDLNPTDFIEARNKLLGMAEADLLELSSAQEDSECVTGGGSCGLYFRYEGFGFCLSEIRGRGCRMERSKIPGQPFPL